MWRICSTCKKDIGFNQVYYVCSVSTCQRQATNFCFCATDCWDAHVPTFRHKDAWAEERTSPKTAAAPQPVTTSAPQNKKAAVLASGPHDILIVASKLKEYVARRAGMNTSASALDVLSDRVRQLCDRAIQRAEQDGRKTVMERDFT